MKDGKGWKAKEAVWFVRLFERLVERLVVFCL